MQETTKTAAARSKTLPVRRNSRASFISGDGLSYCFDCSSTPSLHSSEAICTTKSASYAPARLDHPRNRDDNGLFRDRQANPFPSLPRPTLGSVGSTTGRKGLHEACSLSLSDLVPGCAN